MDLAQSIQQPRAGETYTVVVHVWNLGRFPAWGVAVRAWWVEPGFFSGTPDPRYTAHYIGGAFTELGDRDQGRAHRLVPLPQPWTVVANQEGHECLLAVAEAFADPWSGVFAANADRHVAQRNLTLVMRQNDTASIMNQLDKAIGVGELVTLHSGDVETADLRGAVARGLAGSTDPRRGFGPLRFGHLRRIARLRRTAEGWLSDAPRSGEAGRARPIGGWTRSPARPLAEMVALLMAARATTAEALLQSPLLAGRARAALHLTTEASGYTVLLQR
jgi:hypothetical protein